MTLLAKSLVADRTVHIRTHVHEGKIMRTRTLYARLSTFALLLAITSLLGSLLPPGTLAAATNYVAQGGSDSNDGSESQPFKTIQHGISQLDAGDTLYIRGGNYGEFIDNSSYTIPSGTSFADPVTIAAYPGETVTLRRLLVTSAQYVIFKDFIIDATGQPEGIGIINGDGTATRDNYIRFQNVEMKNWAGPQEAGVFVYSNYNEFLNCKVHDGSVSHGFYIQGSHNLVDGCEVYNNPAYGIQLFNGNNTTLVHNNILRNNRVHNNGGRGAGQGGITINHGDNNIAHDNIICKNEGESLGVSTADDTQIYNNIIYDNSPGGMHIESNAYNTRVMNNTFVLDLDGIHDHGIGTILVDNVCDAAGPGCAVVGDPRQLHDVIADTGCDSQ
jgi:parallel beta-helix repeat protein